MKSTFPAAFEERMIQRLQGEWGAFQGAHEKDPPVSIRINPSKEEGHAGRHVPWCRYGYYLDQRPIFTLDPSFHAGCYYVQEPSSMVIEQVIEQSVDLARPMRVLDLCAAPGGKSTHLLSLLSPDSLLVANEVIRSRATVLSEAIQKWGYANVVVTNNDPENFEHLTGFFDMVLIDAPCSGEGLFRKDPDSLNEWTPANAALCVQRQRRILSHIWPAIKEGGVLIYCTCTYNEEENEGNLAWLQREYAAQPVDVHIEIPGIERTAHGLALMPHKIEGEGFFVAAVRKMERTTEFRIRQKPTIRLAQSKIADRLAPWIRRAEEFNFIDQEPYLMIRQDHLAAVDLLSEHFRTVIRGTAIATSKHDKLIPDHALALSIDLNPHAFEQVDLSKEQALIYLRKEALSIASNHRGFAAAMFEGHPMGWMNLLGNRTNNLYPPSWRIRMAGPGNPVAAE